MKQTKKYFTAGLWIFAFLTLSLLFTLYAAQAGITALLFLGATLGITASLGLLYVLLQTKKSTEALETELNEMKERETARLSAQNQQAGEGNQQYTEIFRIDEYISRIFSFNEIQVSSAEAYVEKVLQNIVKELEIAQALVFILNESDQLFHVSAQYAYFSEEQPRKFQIGEGLSGQVAKNRQMLNLKELPEGYVSVVVSGLGKSAPRSLIIAPIVHDDNCIGIIELASFKTFGENEETLVYKVCESMGNRLNKLRS